MVFSFRPMARQVAALNWFGNKLMFERIMCRAASDVLRDASTETSVRKARSAQRSATTFQGSALFGIFILCPALAFEVRNLLGLQEICAVIAIRSQTVDCLKIDNCYTQMHELGCYFL